MGKHREKEFKRYICRLIVEDGMNMAEVGRNMDIPYATVKTWVSNYRRDVAEGKPLHQATEKKKEYLTPNDYEEKLAAKDKELRQLKEEHKILKKAVHVFTQVHE